jgi:prepilin-type N-terminal cleavage/methylation domain-containing protein
MLIPPAKGDKAGGFSLVETLIGMVVVGIMVTALYAALTTGFKTEQWNREDLRATQILVEKMDQLRVISWDQLADPAVVPREFKVTLNPDDTPTLRGRAMGTNYGLTIAAQTAAGTYQGLVYSGTVSIADPPNDTAYTAEMKQVTVALNWKSASGMPRSRSFTTFVSKYGMQNYKY